VARESDGYLVGQYLGGVVYYSGFYFTKRPEKKTHRAFGTHTLCGRYLPQSTTLKYVYRNRGIDCCSCVKIMEANNGKTK